MAIFCGTKSTTRRNTNAMLTCWAFATFFFQKKKYKCEILENIYTSHGKDFSKTSTHSLEIFYLFDICYVLLNFKVVLLPKP